MRRAVLILPFVLLLVSLVTAGEAEARRGRGIPLPIPGLRSEVVVKVLELPRSPNLMYEGKPIDLGYKFYSGSGGEWVGYIGSDTSYLPFKPDGLERTLALAGLRGLPPVPDRPWQLSELVMLAIGLLLIAFALFKKFMTGLASDDRAVSVVEAGGPLETSGMARADAAMQARIQAMGEGATRPSPQGADARGAAHSLGGARPSFGKRI